MQMSSQIKGGVRMTADNGSTWKGSSEQISSFKGVQNEQITKIIEYKLQGKSDRAIAKAVGVAPSTVNKHFHKYLEQEHDTNLKHLEQTRFQQWIRFDRVIDQVFEQFNKQDFKATTWATILTRLLAEQSKLYGLNTGNININLDQRKLSGKHIEGMPIEDVVEEFTRTHGMTPEEWEVKKISDYVQGTVETYLCLLLFGIPHAESEHERQLLKDIINIDPTKL